MVGSLSHYLQGFIHPKWCRISSINSILVGEKENWGFEVPNGRGYVCSQLLLVGVEDYVEIL